VQVDRAQYEAGLLQSLLQVGVNLSALADRRRMLDMILREARKLARAEAGSLYVLQDDLLEFVVAQNDRMSPSQVTDNFLGRKIPVSQNSLAGFVASTGRTMNIPDAYDLPDDVPFSINKDFDEASGYRTKSLLAIPLTCPDGRCVGVLQLINCLDCDGTVVSFPAAESSGILSLGSMAAITIHNALLQEQLKQAHLDTIIRLAVVAELRDDNTAEHLRRISHSSTLIARAMGLDADQVELIQYASLMHDIGKIAVPDAILLKPASLTVDERRVMEKHTVIGAEILGEPQSDVIATARDVCLTHHERWDGLGYPHQLTGTDIPLCGRIVALADVFDALICERPYKQALPIEKAPLVVRRKTGMHFDPEVAGAFFKVLDEIQEFYRGAHPGPAADLIPVWPAL